MFLKPKVFALPLSVVAHRIETQWSIQLHITFCCQFYTKSYKSSCMRKNRAWKRCSNPWIPSHPLTHGKSVILEGSKIVRCNPIGLDAVQCLFISHALLYCMLTPWATWHTKLTIGQWCCWSVAHIYWEFVIPLVSSYFCPHLFIFYKCKKMQKTQADNTCEQSKTLLYQLHFNNNLVLFSLQVYLLIIMQNTD